MPLIFSEGSGGIAIRGADLLAPVYSRRGVLATGQRPPKLGQEAPPEKRRFRPLASATALAPALADARGSGCGGAKVVGIVRASVA